MSKENTNSNKTVVMNLAFSMAALVVINGLHFFISPYIVRTLGVEANGFVSLANSFLNYALVITTALNSMAGRFVTIEIHKNNIEKASIYYTSTLITNQLFALVFSGITVIFLTNFSRFVNVSVEMECDVRLLFLFVFLNFIIGLFANAFQICYFAKNKLYLSSLRDLMGGLIRATAIIVLFTIFTPRIYYVGIASVLAMLFGITYDFISKRKIASELFFKISNFRIKSVLEIMVSGLWNSINQIGSILNTGLDLLISNLLIGPEGMGLLALSKLMPQMIFIVSATLSNSFSSKIAIHYAKEDKKGIDSSFEFAVKALAIIMTIPIGVFLAFGRNFYVLWQPTQDPSLLYMLSLITLIVYSFTISLTVIFQVYMVENKLRYSSILNLISGGLNVALVLGLLNFTDLGIFAIPLSSGTAFLVKNLFFDFPFVSKLMKKSPVYLWKLSIKTAFAVGYIFVIGTALAHILEIRSWLSLGMNSILLIGIGVLLNFVFFINKEERTQIISRIKGRLYVNR